MQKPKQVYLEKYIKIIEKESNYSKAFLYALQKLTSICRDQQNDIKQKDKIISSLLSLNDEKSNQIENLRKSKIELSKRYSNHLLKQISKLKEKF